MNLYTSVICSNVHFILLNKVKYKSVTVFFIHLKWWVFLSFTRILMILWLGVWISRLSTICLEKHFQDNLQINGSYKTFQFQKHFHNNLQINGSYKTFPDYFDIIHQINENKGISGISVGFWYFVKSCKLYMWLRYMHANTTGTSLTASGSLMEL